MEMGDCNTWTLCSTNSWQGECWEESPQIAVTFAVFLGSPWGVTSLAVGCSMRLQSLSPWQFVLCVVVSPRYLHQTAEGFSHLTRRVYLYLLAKKCGYMQEQAPDLLSLPKRVCACICDNFKHFLLWCEVRVQLFLFYQEIEEMARHLQKSEHLFVQSFPFLSLHLSYVKAMT